MAAGNADRMLARLRKGDSLSPGEQLLLTVRLSVPAMLAQLTAILMGYIDASMVGRLGAQDSASIGLVTTTTWLIYGLCSAASVGFTVQVAHHTGAGDERSARSIVRHGLVMVLAFSLLLSALCAALSGILPVWLGGEEVIRSGASRYFFIFALALPAFQLNHTAGGIIQCSGNMRLPSLINGLMCVLNCVFNALLIFPSITLPVAGMTLRLPGAGLGVTGAALGTALAEAVSAGLMLFFLLARVPSLSLRREDTKGAWGRELVKAVKLGLPVALESCVMGGAYVISTLIVAPLGTVAIAANSFAVTAEGFCYMPGYGIGMAAMTLIGQSTGAVRRTGFPAGRPNPTRRLGWLVTGFGMAVMALSGTLLYVFAPELVGLMTPDAAIGELGTDVLRIAAFSEPLYAAAIVAGGVFRGAGSTLLPCLLTLFSMWGVRLPLMAWLAGKWGLQGVWLGMCLELWVRGSLFLAGLCGRRWTK
ncbi:MAG: MATE family efflux transporter [Fretibacterium sp.]|nr:MATE family efflux transporter [Fretibacterium sp.]